MDMENAKCRALLELLQGRQKLAAVNIQRLFGWGNSRTLRLLVAMREAGLITAEPGRPGQYLVQAERVAQGLPASVMALAGDLLGNGEFLPVGSTNQ